MKKFLGSLRKDLYIKGNLKEYYEKKHFNCRLFIDSNIYINVNLQIYRFIFHKNYSTNFYYPYDYTHYPTLEIYYLFV